MARGGILAQYKDSPSRSNLLSYATLVSDPINSSMEKFSGDRWGHGPQLGLMAKTRQKFVLNKIEGTPILKLAMVKRL